MKQLGVVLLVILFFFIYNRKTVFAEQAKEPFCINPMDKIIYRPEGWNGHSALKAAIVKEKEFSRLNGMSCDVLDNLYAYGKYHVYIVYDWLFDNEDNWHYDRMWNRFCALLFGHSGEEIMGTAEAILLTYTEQLACFGHCVQPEVEKQGIIGKTAWSNILVVTRNYEELPKDSIVPSQGEEVAMVSVRQLRPYNICLVMLLFVIDLILVLLILFAPNENHN